MVKQKKRTRWRRCKRGYLYQLQGGRCYYCGEMLEYEHCTIDHVIPRSLGGTRELGNIVVACVSCNQAKGDRLPDDPVVLALNPRYQKKR